MVRRSLRPVRHALLLGALLSAALLAGVASAPRDASAKEVAGQQARGATPSALRKSAGGNPRVVEIVSSTLGETEFRIADEIATAVASGQETGPNGEVALRVTPVPSRGGASTVRDVLTLPNADFGIVSEIVLDRLNESRDFGDLAGRIEYVAPLYMEEVHLLAGRDVRSLADLQGKAVSIGKDESTTQVVAREILDAAGVKVREERFDLRGSITAIKSGEIAAAFVVSGKPVDGLKTLSPADNLHLVPIDLPAAPRSYLPSLITADDYPELLEPGKRIPTLAAQNVLFAYKWPARSPRGQLGDMFIKSFLWRLATLQKPPNHPKWQEVNLAGTVPGFGRYAVMEAWLKTAASRGRDGTRPALSERSVPATGARAAPPRGDAPSSPPRTSP